MEEKPTRERAIEWYDNLSSKEKRRLCRLHFNHVIIDPLWGEHAKIHIETMWYKETQECNCL